MPIRSFPLDAAIGPRAAAGLELSGTTSMDVATAVAGRKPMPARPGGVLELGAIGLTVATGDDLTFTAGETKVGLSFASGVSAGLGVYDEASAAMAALGLEETPGLDLAVDDDGATRFVLLRSAYTASGRVDGTHPVGAFGSLSFGASSASKGTSAVIQAFDAGKPADAVIRDVVSSWKLPRHVTSAAALAPRTWVVAEANGSVAVTLAAAVGYDFTFVREIRSAGLAGDVGLKIDAAARATLGLNVSGRYLLVVGRESDADAVRVRLFKLARRGLDFGLNLKVGVRGIDSASPDQVDDFVKAVFGVHGTQVVGALARLDAWTDRNTSVGTLVAGLANDRALALVRAATGTDPETAFEAARGRLTDALARWARLPGRAAGELLAILDGLDGTGVRAFRAAVALLADEDDAAQKRALERLFATVGFETQPVGRLVLSLADRGLLTLLDRLPDVRRIASLVLDIVDGDVIRRLQQALSKALDLSRLETVVNETDFAALDSFLVGRLAAFLDRDVGLAEIEEIRKTIGVVLSKRQEVYAKARAALTSRYGAEIAATWQRTTSSSALLDVEIDTSGAAGTRLLAALLKHGDFDALLTSTSKAVTVRAAMLTHETRRRSTLQVSLPRLSFRTERANTSLASVSVQEDGGRLLLYQVEAADVVTDTRRRYRSSLSIGLAAATAVGGSADLRIHGQDRASWSYRLLHARAGMQRAELEMYTRPFLETYLGDRFGNPAQWSAWYAELDQTVEGLLDNGPDQFGDVLLAMDVSMPAEALLAWFAPQADPAAAAARVSMAIQRALKAIVPFYFFQDPDRLAPNASAAALLAWAAMPPTTSAHVEGGQLALNDRPGVYWNHPDPTLRHALVRRPAVAGILGHRFVPIRLRLQEIGRGRQATFFDATEVGDWIALATSENGDRFLQHLCLFEARVVEQAARAVEAMQRFVALKDTAPTQAVDRLAEFGADVTAAFNQLDTVYAKAPVLTVAQGVFLDATRALAAVPNARMSGMLTLTVLKPAGERAFVLDRFVAGATPEPEDVLLEQRMVGTAG